MCIFVNHALGHKSSSSSLLESDKSSNQSNLSRHDQLVLDKFPNQRRDSQDVFRG
jgi:hypothetical protein